VEGISGVDVRSQAVLYLDTYTQCGTVGHRDDNLRRCELR
jgi:hypothetical protein